MTVLGKFKAYQASITPEQRAELLAKGREKRKENLKKLEENKHLLKLDYMDEGYWSVLATSNKVRMPSKIAPTSVKLIRKYLKRCNVPRDVFDASYTSASYFVENNPKWTEYATAGLILELKESMNC